MLLPIGTTLLAFASVISAQITDPNLTGTWSSKAKTVFTGPSFYDPVGERLIEPKHPGISYSFSDDGHYEVAYYRAIPNPVQPKCPKGIMQWQHGTWTKYENGSLVLTPLAIDGRQLLSNPCKYEHAIYTRYNQSELFERYEVRTDPYHNVMRLNLFQFDGSPLMPLYQEYTSPLMLPVQTLNPTSTSTGAGTQKTGSKFRRSVGDERVFQNPVLPRQNQMSLADKWWWIGVGMTGLGGVLYLCF
ncbi:hypothetical protein P152DRAFT_315282 [Eremomyces bilateralis CBS 781.70]|uniref:Protein ROT1 n=1 Tax=Eremomyces bilateralis CBS 781.70 TaxID=1392243 RepID=A0A6G1G5P0_9PEZI|nr:uncharacterized protein P152DRAFT_315282 [Eremomyces bilateralis CBS 781.70]KAF1813338.1 hypothetical protein P152DRAFT_315282 [Eremomyces bilateralis CBS 781.70]